MRKVSPIFGRSLGLVCALLLAACGQDKDTALTVLVIGAPASPFQKGVRLSPAARLIRQATAEGLVGFDEQGQIVPGLADRWIVTDDGLSYIFRLRDGAWADGNEFDAKEVVSALRQATTALRGTPLARDLSMIDEIRSMTGRVIEIRLAAPVPNLLQLLAQPELGLTRRGQGTGPMRLRRDGDVAVLSALPPESRGLPADEKWSDVAGTVRLIALPAAAAVERFQDGDADVLLGGRFEDFPLARSIGLLRPAVLPDPVQGLFGLAVMNDEGFLSAPENREVLALAMDREALIAPLGVSGWAATTRLVAAGVADDPGTIGERWAELPMEERRAQAAARVTRWRRAQPGADVPVRLRVGFPKGSGADLLFERVRADFGAVGIVAERVGPDDEADLRLLDAVARYPRVGWFLNQLGCVPRRGLCSFAADRLALQAQQASDPVVRAGLLSDAEAELTKANVFIPFGAPIRWSLVRGRVGGFATNRWAVHPLMPMAMRPK
jgi:hypothetical protein